MTGIVSVIAALILLSLLIMFHEFGHFFVGKKLGFCIVEYSVGMGPVLLNKEINGTVYSIRALPIGGMCRFFGEDADRKDPRSFSAFPLWKRFLTVSAGPAANLLLAFILSIVMMLIFGGYQPKIVVLSDPASPAAVSGLAAGDVLVAIDGEEIPSFEDTIPMLRASSKDGFSLTVLRDGKELTFHLSNVFDEEKGYNYLGVTIGADRVHYSLPKSIRYGIDYVASAIGSVFSFFGSLFKGQVSRTDVSGTVGAVAVISEAIHYGAEVVLAIAVLLNVSLGMMNLLPIPALDGGRLFFMLIEAVRGKPIDPEKEGLVHAIGLLLLFGLMIFLTFNDIRNLIS